jgi:hypothetical protein
MADQTADDQRDKPQPCDVNLELPARFGPGFSVRVGARLPQQRAQSCYFLLQHLTIGPVSRFL